MRFQWRNKAFFSCSGGKRYGYHAAEVWVRDNKQCSECGTRRTLKNLVIHHIIPYDPQNELTMRIENLVVVCRKCHSRLHDNGKKVPNYQLPKPETLKRIGFDVLVQEQLVNQNGNL